MLKVQLRKMFFTVLLYAHTLAQSQGGGKGISLNETLVQSRVILESNIWRIYDIYWEESSKKIDHHTFQKPQKH